MVDAIARNLSIFSRMTSGDPASGNHLISEIAAGIGQRAPMRYQAARHVSLSFRRGWLTTRQLFHLLGGRHAP